MRTVSSNTRNISLYLVAAMAITLLGLLMKPGIPSITLARKVLIPDTGSKNAADIFRQEELALYNRPAASSIGSPSFFEYRRGEWSTGGMSAADAFRHEELALYNRQAASSIGSPSFFEYRRGEWPTAGVDAIGAFRQEELSLYHRTGGSSIGSPAFIEYRRGEWFGE